MSKKIKSIKTKNVKSTSASVATNATPNFSINSKREILPISTTSKGLYSMGRTNCFTMKKLDEFITNSIEARRDDKTVPIIRVVADYSTTFRLWELAVVDYNTCGMTKKELFSNYFCVGGESGEGEGHIAGFGSTAIFTLTRGTHPFSLHLRAISPTTPIASTEACRTTLSRIRHTPTLSRARWRISCLKV